MAATATRKTFRIVSLCPSTTETLYDLGLAEYVVGRTGFCNDRPGATTSNSLVPSIPKVGGTKNPKWDRIADLRPTHILFNLEENDYTHLPKAREICTTIADTPVDVVGSKDLVLNLGNIFGASQKAEDIVCAMDDALTNLRKQRRTNPFTYLYFIWHTPNRMLAGKGTYIESMLSEAGGQNLAHRISDERYPLFPTTFDEVADYCLLSTEPYHFKERHIKEYERFGRKTCIIDGEKVSWHGSKTVEGLEYLRNFF